MIVLTSTPAQIGRGEQEYLEGPQIYGSLDEFSVFHRALAGPEIEAIHAANHAGKCR